MGPTDALLTSSITVKTNLKKKKKQGRPSNDATDFPITTPCGWFPKREGEIPTQAIGVKYSTSGLLTKGRQINPWDNYSNVMSFS